MSVDSRPELLFLCHRIPYPPDKGDKIRSYHWFRALAKRFRVHLAAFVDDPRDWQYREAVQALCASTLLLPLDSRRARLRSLSGLLRGEPLTLPYYRDRRLRAWIAELGEVTRVFVYSSAMAQYAQGPAFKNARRVIDFVDVDSDKWRQYAERRRGPMGMVYKREANRLEAFELAIARSWDASLFVSPAEADWFRARFGPGTERVSAVSNGVDSAWFNPELGFADPFPSDTLPLVFTGAMDYWANVDAVTWFVQEVWPRVRERVPSAAFHIVGSRPTTAVQALAGNGVVVTGRVPDVRPYLRHAHAVIAPMRIARGIQNKVLEGMAMARPVVVTPKGLEGIAAADGREVLVAEDAAGFARQVLRALQGETPELGKAARELVLRDYAWVDHCRRLVELVAGSTAVT